MIINNVKRGGIYLANLGNQFGSVQSGKRPVIVISNPKNNRFSPVVNVLPITSKRKNNIPVHVNIGTECGLKRESTVLTEQVITVDKGQLIEYIGSCNNKTMAEITRAMVIQFHMIEDVNFAG